MRSAARPNLFFTTLTLCVAFTFSAFTQWGYEVTVVMDCEDDSVAASVFEDSLQTFPSGFIPEYGFYGRVYDESTNLGIAYAAIIIWQNGRAVGGAYSDEQGFYSLPFYKWPPGQAIIKADITGYNPLEIWGLDRAVAASDSTKAFRQDIRMSRAIYLFTGCSFYCITPLSTATPGRITIDMRSRYKY